MARLDTSDPIILLLGSFTTWRSEVVKVSYDLKRKRCVVWVEYGMAWTLAVFS
jgi:hypothetical protein